MWFSLGKAIRPFISPWPRWRASIYRGKRQLNCVLAKSVTRAVCSICRAPFIINCVHISFPFFPYPTSLFSSKCEVSLKQNYRLESRTRGERCMFQLNTHIISASEKLPMHRNNFLLSSSLHLPFTFDGITLFRCTHSLVDCILSCLLLCYMLG